MVLGGVKETKKLERMESEMGRMCKGRERKTYLSVVNVIFIVFLHMISKSSV